MASASAQVVGSPTVNGVIQNEDADYFSVEAKKGQRITVEVEGMRLGLTMFDPCVAILSKDGRELAKISTKRGIVHGVVVSPDDRYAFVSVEGVGTEPGTVEMIDLAALKTVATVDVAPQAGGIDFYKIER